MIYPDVAIDALRLLAGACSVWIVVLAFRNPSLLIRPSFLLTSLVHIRLQWSSVISDNVVRDNLTHAANYYFLVHGFVVLSLGFVVTSGALGLNRYSKLLFDSATRPASAQTVALSRNLPWLLVVSIGISAFYFTLVPFRSTGLYALFADPTGLGDARHTSLAGIGNSTVAYLATWQINTFAPMLVAVASVRLAVARKGLGLVIFGLTLMTITGSRAGFAYALAVLAIVHALLRGGRWRAVIPVALVAFMLVVASTTLITLVREGREVTRESSQVYAGDIGLGRIFSTPLKTSVYYVKFVEAGGPAGLATVRPLAQYFGREYIPLSRVIGRTYVDPGSTRIVTNTNFLGAYYGGFGMLAIPISILGLILFDLLLIPLTRAPEFALPMVGSLSVKALMASEGVLHTSFISGGYILLPVIAWLVVRSRTGPSAQRGETPCHSTPETRT